MEPFIFLKTFRTKKVLFGTLTLLAVTISCLFLFSSIASTKNLTAKEIMTDKIIAIDPGHEGYPYSTQIFNEMRNLKKTGFLFFDFMIV